MKKHAVWPDIHARTLGTEMRQIVFAGNKRAEGHLTAIRRGRRTVYRVADRRSAAVASNQGVSFDDHAVHKVRGDAAFALQKPVKSMSEMNAVGIVAKHSRLQRVMKVRAINLEVSSSVF